MPLMTMNRPHELADRSEVKWTSGDEGAETDARSTAGLLTVPPS